MRLCEVCGVEIAHALGIVVEAPGMRGYMVLRDLCAEDGTTHQARVREMCGRQGAPKTIERSY